MSYQGKCENCGRPMFATPGGWRSRQRRWCSRECRTAGNHAEQRAPHAFERAIDQRDELCTRGGCRQPEGARVHQL